MSHVHDGPLATYNSLTDQNLSGYFGNTRMRRHLRKSGLVNRRGELVTENQYRVNMARKEHKKHVKELLAQAIVHKTLDLERYRQVEIKRKLEEISKIELVRRVRATRGRKGDEEVLPYLSPRSMSRPQSERPSQSSNVHRRPKSAPAPPRNRPASSRGFVDPYEDVIYVDDDGRPVSPPPSDRANSDRASSKDLKTEGIDTRHLYALDSEALQKYALKLSKREQGRDGAVSPYLISQFPVPPRSPRSERVRSARSPRRSARMSARPEGPRKEKKVGVRGALMLHRSEPAMMHQGEVQTLCEITMKYHGPNLTLPRDQNDPTQEVAIDQQHCGGNTLPVFKERLQGGKTFSFISRRHRGYPFSLTLYIDGRVDCRVSTCCEYKHGVGVRLGGKMGHFSLTGITGATPCYKCKLSCQAPPRSLKLKKSGKKKKAPEPQEEVTVDNTPRSPVVPSKREEPEVNGKSDDDYEDDFEEDNKYEDDFEPEPTEDRRQIIGLQVDEVRENGQTVKVDVKEKEEEEAKEGTLPDHRRIEGYSSEDEDLQGGREPFRVNAVVHETKKKKVRRSSSSSSSDSSRPTTPVPEKVIPVKVVGVKADATPEKKKRRGSSSSSSSSSSNSDSSRSTTPVPASAVIPSKADVPLKSDRTEATTERSTTSTTSGSLTTATESTLEPRPPAAPKPRKGRGNKSSTSSSSSDSSMDSDDEKYKRKKRDKRLKEESERMKREMEEKERERKKRQEEDEARKKKEEEERKKRFEEEDRRRNEELRKREEERKQREIEINERKREEERKKQEEQQKRQAEEDRMKAEYEKQLLLIKQQRESDDNIVVNKPESNERSVIEIESRPTYTSAPAQQESVTPVEKAPSSSSDTDSSTSGTTTTTESEPDKDKGKPNVAPMTTITEEKEKPKERRSSSSSTGSSSSSSSDGEYAVNEQKKEAEPAKDEVKPVPVVTETVEVKAEQKETLVPPQSQQKASSSEGSSSSSGSSTESESDEDNKRVGSPKQAVMEVHERQPLVEEPVAKSMAADEPPQPVTAETVSYQQKKEETEDSSSDSSSSDSSDSSDSESESKDNKRPKTAMDTGSPKPVV